MDKQKASVWAKFILNGTVAVGLGAIVMGNVNKNVERKGLIKKITVPIAALFLVDAVRHTVAPFVNSTVDEALNIPPEPAAEKPEPIEAVPV